MSARSDLPPPPEEGYRRGERHPVFEPNWFRHDWERRLKHDPSPAMIALQWFLIFLPILAAVVWLGVMAGSGSTARCDPPRHWQPVSCSKGCMYACR